MTEFSLLRWIQLLSVTSFVIFIESQVFKKKSNRELQHKAAAGPGESFMIITDPHDHTAQTKNRSATPITKLPIKAYFFLGVQCAANAHKKVEKRGVLNKQS